MNAKGLYFLQEVSTDTIIRLFYDIHVAIDVFESLSVTTWRKSKWRTGFRDIWRVLLILTCCPLAVLYISQIKPITCSDPFTCNTQHHYTPGKDIRYKLIRSDIQNSYPRCNFSISYDCLKILHLELPMILLGSYWVWVQPVRDDVTM